MALHFYGLNARVIAYHSLKVKANFVQVSCLTDSTNNGVGLKLWVRNFVHRSEQAVEPDDDVHVMCCNKGCLRALVQQDSNYIQETRAQLRGENTYEHDIGMGSGRRASQGKVVKLSCAIPACLV